MKKAKKDNEKKDDFESLKNEISFSELRLPEKQNKRYQKNRFGHKKTLRKLSIIVSLILVGFLFGIIEINSLYSAFDTKSQISIIKNWKTAENTVIFDANGKKLSERYSTYQKFTPIEKIPRPLIEATIAIEDKRFFEHGGVDFYALIRAGIAWIKSGKPKQGGSTITQQLVRKFVLYRQKNVFRKLHEIILALELEKVMTKNEILESYLNNLFLGNGSYGVTAASKRYFGKDLDALGIHEMALISGLFQAPSKYNPFKNPKLALKRQRQVLTAMVASGKISPKTAKKISEKRIKLKHFNNKTESINSYYVDYVANEAKSFLGVKSLKNKGYKIYTALDEKINLQTHTAIKSMSKQFTQIEKQNNFFLNKNAIEAAALVLDIKTGAIVSMIGGRNYSKSSFNRAYQARRSPGSAFKPIVYSLALMEGHKWSDVFYVAPIALAGNYKPRSESSDYMSESTMLRALYRSLNATTMEIGEKIGLKKVLDHAQNFGISSPLKMEYGSLLGQSEVTLIEMAKVYSVFANAGKRINPIVITKIEDKHGKIIFKADALNKRENEVLNPQINYLMVQALRKVLTHGTGRKAGHLARIAGGKTGTTNNSVDNWFCGFSSNHVVIVWVGSNKPQPIYRGNAQGSTLALPIWSNIMDKLVQNDRKLAFFRPPGVQSVRVHPEYGHKSGQGIEMWFLSNMLPEKKSSALEELEKTGGLIRGFGVH